MSAEQPPTRSTPAARPSPQPPALTEVRIHGRGGQGVVTAAEVLSVAAFRQGLHAQAFPSFGSERTGAPVVSFCRISGRPIRARDPIAEPDVVVIQDVTLLGQVAVFAGLKPSGWLLLNSPLAPDELDLDRTTRTLGLAPDHIATVPATAIAIRHVGRAVSNVPLLGAFAALTGVVGLDAVVGAIEERFSGPTAVRNVAAAREAYETVRVGTPATQTAEVHSALAEVHHA